MWQYEYADELYHYGVKGQKWGVRRYQDKNGRLKRGHEKRYGEWPPKGRDTSTKDQKRLAKIGATLESRGNAYSKRASLAINKQQKLQSKRFDKLRKSGDNKYGEMPEKEDRLFNKYVSNAVMADKMYKLRDTAVKDLSDQQIQYGRRYVKASPAIGYLLAGPVGVGVLSAIDESRANQYIREYGDK